MSDDGKQNPGVDIGEFLDFYLLDSQEQVENLSAGLLELEKGGNNNALINEMFRSAHSLKGASGTMGFAQIVSLTHAAEDLLDRLRQGKMEVSPEMIDVLLSMTDRVKEMLSQVERRETITLEYEDVVNNIKGLISGKGTKAMTKEATASQVDFQLKEEEVAQINFALVEGHGVYELSVKFAADTLMKAVRAVMAIQRLESLGSVIKINPSIEEIESGSYEGFSLLVITDESPKEIETEIGDISELENVGVIPYTFNETQEKTALQELTSAEKEVAAASTSLAEAEPVVAPTPKPLIQNNADSGKNEGHNQVHTIRVDTTRLDNLINLVGEMVITRTRLVQIGLDLKEQHRMDSLVNGLNETTVYLGRLMNDLQESAMRLRMVPIGTVFSRFPRLVRDLSRKTDKEIDLVLKGEETELDKTVVEVIGDPLMHLIRNSVDHGIESPEERIASGKPERGQITLEAYHEGNHISILVSDDGKGLDLVKIRQKAISRGLIDEREELADRESGNLIFLPGFSTAEKVTDISGRGVGMDVVKKAMNNLGGTIEISTVPGKGTTFTIRLPLTLAIIQALLVEVGSEIYAIPLGSVLETLLVQKRDVKLVGGQEMVQIRGNTLPLISLREKYGLPSTEEELEEVYVVVVGLGDKTLGLVVDELRGQQEIVIKSLGDILINIPGIAGATILGDGKITLILDIGSLIQDILITRKS